MGRRRKPGAYPYDYTEADDRRFAGSGVGGTLRVLHGPGRGMGVTDGVTCRAEVVGADGSGLDEAHAGKYGKEHRLRGTAPGQRITVAVTACFDGDEECGCAPDSCRPVLDELTATVAVVLTGDLHDVVRSGVGPAWDDVVAIDTGDVGPAGVAPKACRWGAGVRIRGARSADGPTAEDVAAGRGRRTTSP